jgi:neutral ceramidase
MFIHDTMSSPRFAFCHALLVLTSVTLFGAPPAEPGIHVGFADRDITPDIGMEVPGNYGKVYSKKIHDPCKVRASVFDDGRKRVALVGIDALMIRRQTVLEIRALVKAATGIADVMIGASHSHSSGPIGMILPGEFDHAPAEIQELAYKKSSCADAGYLRKAIDATVAAVVAADQAKTAVTVGYGVGHESRVAFNRRLRMRNGLTFSHPGKNNPDVVEFANPTDDEVGVIGVWRADGSLAGCIVNFSCHATTNSDGIGANWIYYTEKVIQGYYGRDAKVVFLQGACGDVTQVNNLDPKANPAPDDWSQFVGGRVGAECLKVLLSMSQTRTAEVPLAADQKVWEIGRRIPAPETVAEARERIKGPPTHKDWVWAKETLLLDALLARKHAVEVEVQAIQLGPVVCLSNPAEYFVSYGLQLKKRSGFPMTFPVELANGCVGYVPDEEAFGPRGGGYETRLTSYSNLETTAGTQFMNVGLELAAKMKPAKLPERPDSPTGKPWAYGDQPPQLK